MSTILVHSEMASGAGLEEGNDGGSIVAVEDRERLPALPTVEVERAKDYARASRAASTRRVYESDWRHFAAWGLDRNVPTLPAAAAVVAVYLVAEKDRGLSPLTIGRKLAAIGGMHRNSGY